MDLQYPVDNRALISGIVPPRFEYDSDYVFTRISVVELRNGVLHRQVLFEEMGLLENLTACRTGEDVVPEWEEEIAVSRCYVRFR